MTKAVTCNNYSNSCLDCVLNVCFFILLTKGREKCVDMDEMKDYDLLAPDVISATAGCRELPVTRLPILSMEHYIRDYKLTRSNYNRSVPPTFAGNIRTNVSIAMTVESIIVNVTDSTFAVFAALYMEWKDERLDWLPTGSGLTAHENLTVAYEEREIWWPNITVVSTSNNSSRDSVQIRQNEHSLLTVNHLGEVTWNRTLERLATFCDYNLFRWPYDNHICSVTLTVGSWCRHNWTDLTLLSQTNKLVKTKDISLDLHWIENSEWKITGLKAARREFEDQCCRDPLVDLVYTFTIKRQWSYSIGGVIVGTFMIILVNVTALRRPLTNFFKLVFLIVFMLAILSLLYYFSLIRSATHSVSLIMILYSWNLVPILFQYLMTGIFWRYSLSGSPRIFPWCNNSRLLKFLLLGHPLPPLAPEELPMTCGIPRGQRIRAIVGQLGYEDGKVDDPLSPRDLAIHQRKEWLHVVTVFQRIFTIIYTLFTASICLFFMSYFN